MAIDTIITTGGAGFYAVYAADSSIEDVDEMGQRLEQANADEYREELGDAWDDAGHGYEIEDDLSEVEFQLSGAGVVAHGDMIASGSEG